MAVVLPSQFRLKQLLDYDAATGVFTWKVNRHGPAKAGTRAGTERQGYRHISVSGVKQSEHRWAFLWMTGQIPSSIDHRDGEGTNNRWSNLREATHSENMVNFRRERKNNLPHHIYQRREGGLYLVVIKRNKEVIYRKSFTDLGSAVNARDLALMQVGGKFSPWN